MAKFISLKGKLLIAMPSIEGDDFNRSVIYVCTHNSDGAMGLVINKPIGDMIFADLVEKLDVQSKGTLIDENILQTLIWYVMTVLAAPRAVAVPAAAGAR